MKYVQNGKHSELYEHARTVQTLFFSLHFAVPVEI